MKCKLYRTVIEEMADGVGLSPEARAHLGACARCREFYEEQTRVARLVGELARVAAPNDFEFRLRARLAAADTGERRSMLRRGFVPGAVSIALATVFVFAVALTLRLRQRTDAGQAVARIKEASATKPAVNPAVNEDRAGGEVKTATVATAGKEDEKGPARISGRVAAERDASLVAAKEVAGNSKSRKNHPEAVESDVRPAPVINTPAPANEVALTNPPIAVSLHTSSQPLKVILSDAHGTTRVVPMKSVSFGAQQLVGQVKESSRNALASKEGVW